MRRAFALLASLSFSLSLSGCGLSVSGEFAPSTQQAPSAEAGASLPPSSTAQPDGSMPDVDANDANDAGTDDAMAPAPVMYAVGERFFSYVPTTFVWTWTEALPFTSCPTTLDELAANESGALFGVGNGRRALYVVKPHPTDPVCTKVNTVDQASGTYPRSLAFAPKGTLDVAAEVLVGYDDDGNYVRIDTALGTMVTITNTAASGLAIGDVVSVGSKGYIIATGSGCDHGDCLFEIDFSTGLRTSSTPTAVIQDADEAITGLAHWAGKIVAFSGGDEVYQFASPNFSTVTKLNGPPGVKNLAFHGAASSTAAPTN
ncbi:hypothetical protein AKJ09_07301 [Labilithrix luteola]|uniref:Lipoprotein n=1 Tax=Labilithrix luteola TaxID=1391654 RepID=A0A0K1Q4H4_9BACT|nr:hypothetical protein [Labilithrix luteola]AKV00638.1 hypothetical protein AKJ09_07301 [Labilithrix luteola]